LNAAAEEVEVPAAGGAEGVANKFVVHKIWSWKFTLDCFDFVKREMGIQAKQWKGSTVNIRFHEGTLLANIT